MKYKVYMLAFEQGKIREVEVPEAEVSASTEDLLERIFYWGQNDFQPQKICSVSTGDVAEVNGEFWQVRGVGWKRMSKEEFEVLLGKVQRGEMDALDVVQGALKLNDGNEL